MPDYQNMTATEAMRHAKDVSGMTTEEIASEMGVRSSVIRRYLQLEDGYSPSLDRIPELCLAMRNTVLLQWIETQLEPMRLDVPPAQSRAEVLTAVARVSASLGDAQRRLVASEGKGIDPACARDVRGLLKDVIEDCRYAQAMLAEQASHADMRDSMPLASLRPVLPPEMLSETKQEPMPWWFFWRRNR